jgi:hypothetical protein
MDPNDASIRQQAWHATSQSGGLGSLPPNAAVLQQPQAVVVVAEAVPDALDLLMGFGPRVTFRPGGSGLGRAGPGHGNHDPSCQRACRPHSCQRRARQQVARRSVTLPGAGWCIW